MPRKATKRDYIEQDSNDDGLFVPEDEPLPPKRKASPPKPKAPVKRVTGKATEPRKAITKTTTSTTSRKPPVKSSRGKGSSLQDVFATHQQQFEAEMEEIFEKARSELNPTLLSLEKHEQTARVFSKASKTTRSRKTYINNAKYWINAGDTFLSQFTHATVKANSNSLSKSRPGQLSEPGQRVQLAYAQPAEPGRGGQRQNGTDHDGHTSAVMNRWKKDETELAEVFTSGLMHGLKVVEGLLVPGDELVQSEATSSGREKIANGYGNAIGGGSVQGGSVSGGGGSVSTRGAPTRDRARSVSRMPNVEEEVGELPLVETDVLAEEMFEKFGGEGIDDDGETWGTIAKEHLRTWVGVMKGAGISHIVVPPGEGKRDS